jgi:hypothetical protein
MKKPKKKITWEEVGEIAVDAGLCWIGDPCYCVTPDASNHPAKTWSEFCDLIKNNRTNNVTKFNFSKRDCPYTIDGLGICVQSGYGDGRYPVFVKRTKDGLLKEVRVKFI